MARQLWLFRHADAEPHGARPDAERRLTSRGEQQARTAGVALKRLGAAFDEVLFSPKVRARETAELAATSWNAKQREALREYEPLAEGFSAEQARDVLSAMAPDARVLLVGHEPDLSRLVGALAGGEIDLKKGGVAVLRLEGLSGELAVLLRPRELALIAGVPVDGD
jgi:phosphohistidine phosphatase